MTRRVRWVAFALSVLGAFSLGFAWKDLTLGEWPSADAFSRLLAGPARRTVPTPTQVFRESYQHISSHYVRAVDSDELKYGAMEGLMASLGDPHTAFLDPKSTRRFAEETQGGRNYSGIGARLAPDPLGVRIMSVFRGGPAERAGIRNGDVVIAVDGKTIAGVAVDDVVNKIKGEPSSTVRLEILRGNEPTPRVFSVVRRTVTAPTAEGTMVPDTKFGLITIWQFAENTVSQFDQALQDLEQQGIRGLIIDVRNNPGGLLQSAVDILSRFVSNKRVVTMRLRGGQQEVVDSPSGAVHSFRYPVVVLVNENSASAAEIFAGVLKDYGKATIIGENTYGKSSVQNLFNVGDGATAKITIARYFLPSGTDISRRVDEEGQYLSGGLVPHVTVRLDQNLNVILGDPRTDNQLQKAIAVLEEKL